MFGQLQVLCKRFGRSDGGSVILEFVALLPLLFIFLFLMIGIGQALWYHQVITGGVRDGVRYLSRAPLEDPFIQSAKVIALTGDPSGGSPAFVFWNDPDTIEVELTPLDHGGAFRGPDPLTIIRMTAAVPVTIPVLDFFGLDPDLTLRATDRARHIGE